MYMLNSVTDSIFNVSKARVISSEEISVGVVKMMEGSDVSRMDVLESGLSI
jgi:hypothetical protein